MKTKMKTLMCAVLSAAVGLGMASVSNAQVIYSNDFSGADNVENDFGTDENGNFLPFHFGPFGTVAADADFATQYFSVGSAPDGNFRFGRFDGSLTTPAAVANTVLAYEFDGLFRSADSAVYRLRLRNSDTNNTNFSGNVDLTQANVTPDVVHQFLVVFNNDAADITLDASLNSQGITSTVPAGMWELFLDGARIGADGLTGELTGFGDRLALWNQGDPNAGTQSFFYFDDFQVFTNSGVVTGPLLGDADLNGVVNFLDIGPFISILSSNGFLDQADIDRDGDVDFLDIQPFIDILAG